MAIMWNLWLVHTILYLFFCNDAYLHLWSLLFNWKQRLWQQQRETGSSGAPSLSSSRSSRKLRQRVQVLWHSTWTLQPFAVALGATRLRHTLWPKQVSWQLPCPINVGWLPLTLITLPLTLITFRVNKICSNDRNTILKAKNMNLPSGRYCISTFWYLLSVLCTSINNKGSRLTTAGWRVCGMDGCSNSNVDGRRHCWPLLLWCASVE